MAVKQQSFKWILLAFVFGQLAHAVPSSWNSKKSPISTVAVIGAGPTGLMSTKHALDHGFKVDVFEKGAALGGTWVYTNDTGIDKYGVPVHSAMYSGLRANHPYQLFEFPGLKFPNDSLAFPKQEDVLTNLHNYADHYGLEKRIKYHHLVEQVIPIKKNKWIVVVRNVQKNKTISKVYDSVFICINMYSSPNYPQIDGVNEFNGRSIHSHDYRKPEDFLGDKLLIIGGGPSGIDLVKQLVNSASHVTFSTRDSSVFDIEPLKNGFGDKLTLKNDVIRFTPNGAEFKDGSYLNFTAVIFATGYKYNYPFLEPTSTGIHVEDNYVQPLYKQIFNIDHPTMVFIGVPYFSVYVISYDLQVRFAMKYISGAKKLPSKQKMLEDMENYAECLGAQGYSTRKLHTITVEAQKKYWQKLAETAEIEMFPEVYADIATYAFNSFLVDPYGFRSIRYKIIDDKTFTKEVEEYSDS